MAVGATTAGLRVVKSAWKARLRMIGSEVPDGGVAC